MLPQTGDTVKLGESPWSSCIEVQSSVLLTPMQKITTEKDKRTDIR